MAGILTGINLPPLISDDDSDSSTDVDTEDNARSRVTSDLPPLVADSDSSDIEIEEIVPSRVTSDLPPLLEDSDSSDSNDDPFHDTQSDGEQFSDPESLPDLETESSDDDDSDGHIDDELFRRDDSSGMSDDGVHFSDDEFDMTREELGVVQMLDQHLDVLQAAPSFIAISLRMLYERVLGAMEPEEDKDSPTRPDIILKLPMVKIDAAQVDSKESCCICFLDYSIEESVMKLPCEHLYHKDCILNWFKIRSTCPKCRLDLNVTFPSNHGSSTNRENEGLTDETVASVTSRLMRALVNNVGRYDVTDFDEDASMAEPVDSSSGWYSATDFIDPDSNSENVGRGEPDPDQLVPESDTTLSTSDSTVSENVTVATNSQGTNNEATTSVSRLRRLFEPTTVDNSRVAETSSVETSSRSSSVSRLRRLFDQPSRNQRRRLLDMNEIRQGPQSQPILESEGIGVTMVSNDGDIDTKTSDDNEVSGMEVET